MLVSKFQALHHVQVHSITTLATPHYGSSYADMFFPPSLVHSILDKKRKSGDGPLGWRSFGGAVQCTTVYARECLTKEQLPDNPAVHYLSVPAGVERIEQVGWSMRVGWRRLMEREGVNDGLVSVQSAKWGRVLETVEADHLDLIQLWPWRSKECSFEAQPFYRRLMDTLQELEH
jgi:hypothetical protein